MSSERFFEVLQKQNECVTVNFSDKQVTELFNLLEKNKEDHPELHEVVYQAMTKTLMARVNLKCAREGI